MSVYETLFDWQKLFVQKTPSEYFVEVYGQEKPDLLPVKTDSEIERIGFFLRMGIGKTKITVAKAEKNNADCVFAVSLRSKVVAGEMEGEFGYELKLAGYKVFYAHKAYDENGELNIKAVDSKQQLRAFTDAVEAGEKIAYIFNHEHITTKKGYQRLVYLASKYKNISWIIDEAHKISNEKSAVSKRIYNMLYSRTTPDIKVKIRELKKERKEAELKGDLKTVEDLNALEKLVKENVFRENIKSFYLATGTPNASGYRSFYWLLVLLGHEWTYTGPVIENEEIVKKTLRGYNAFFEEFCIEDTYAKKFNPYARAIKGYKNTDRLLDIVQQYGFFAKTSNYFKGMPSRLTSILWAGKDINYTRMTDPAKKNKYYRVLDGFICDTPSLLRLRAKQLTSGFMGNAEKSSFYHTAKVDLLEELLGDQPDNYLIFYNYTPELYMIIAAAEEKGYNIDVWNGTEKRNENYRKAKGTAGEKNVLIANIASGSAAMNFQKYSKVVFFSLPDVFMDFDQAIGRVERIGQVAEEVEVILLLMKGTIDEKIWENLKVGRDYTEKMYLRDFLWRETIKQY